jgi:hypothetical protein
MHELVTDQYHSYQCIYPVNAKAWRFFGVAVIAAPAGKFGFYFVIVLCHIFVASQYINAFLK